MLNLYKFHITPTLLDGYEAPPTIEIIVNAIKNELVSLRDHLHKANMYDATQVEPPYNTLMRYVDDFEFSQTEYDTISFNFKDAAGEFLATHNVVKGYVNDVRVDAIDVDKLKADDLLSSTGSSKLHKFINDILQIIAYKLENNNA
jgi:hypothetical protein